MLVCDNNEGATLHSRIPVPTILVLMRDAQVAAAIRQSLEFANPALHLVTAESGSEAHALLQRESVSLAITILPVKTGFEFVAIASERYPQVPHIAASCSPAEDLDEVALRLMDVLERQDEEPQMDRLALSLVEALILQRVSSGFLRAIPLLDTIRLLEADACTATLSLRQSKTNAQAVLFFRNGRLLDAHSSNSGGLEAAKEVLGWADVHIAVSSGCRDIEARIDKPVYRLLEEWLAQAAQARQVADEVIAPEPVCAVEPPPPVERVIVRQPTMREILASQELEYDIEADWQSPPNAAVAEAKQPAAAPSTLDRLLETVDYDPSGLDQGVIEAPTVDRQRPTPAFSPGMSFSELMDAGFDSFRRKDFREAIGHWQKASEIDPENRTLHYNLKLAQTKLAGAPQPFAVRAAYTGRA